MRIILCLLAICFIQSSIGVPLGREAVNDIKFDDGGVLYDGDIVLTKDEVKALERGSLRSKRAVALDTLKWPDNTINYFYDWNMGVESIKLMEAAFDYVRSRTCIKLIKNGISLNLLRITADKEWQCASYVGFHNMALQNLWFSNGCLSLGTGGVVHELMHTLGVDHEQSRYDRDQYLDVDMWNAYGGEHNFIKRTELNSYNPTPFEYGSTMMYSYDAFGTGVIRPKDMDYKYTIGNRRVSFYDMVKINKHYECENKCINQLKCKNGGCTNPANCNVCNCPHGYEGASCDQLPAERVSHTANKTWATHWVNFGDTSANKLVHPDYTYIVIKAPTRKTIEVQITKLENFTCSYGCRKNGVEVKFNGDPRITNPIFCCDDKLDRTRILKSKHNPTIISLYTVKGNSTITYRFRYIDEDFTLGPKTTDDYDSYEYYK